MIESSQLELEILENTSSDMKKQMNEGNIFDSAVEALEEYVSDVRYNIMDDAICYLRSTLKKLSKTPHSPKREPDVTKTYKNKYDEDEVVKIWWREHKLSVDEETNYFVPIFPFKDCIVRSWCGIRSLEDAFHDEDCVDIIKEEIEKEYINRQLEKTVLGVTCE